MQISFTSNYDPFKHKPRDWPDRTYYVSEHEVRRDQFEAFHNLICEQASETRIEEFLRNNCEVLVLIMSLFSTGHHASWAFPKKCLRPPSDSPGGIIPDYLLAGANSDGVSWFLLELKGANHSAFTKRGKRVFLSREANEGMCQLLNYIDLSSRAQSYLRDELQLTSFREPRGILLIGTEEESKDDQVKEFKRAWNSINSRVQIRSYHALVRLVERKLRDFGR